ncbi:MAG: prolyl 4-hydroxylase [Halioglobus sp.]
MGTAAAQKVKKKTRCDKLLCNRSYDYMRNTTFVTNPPNPDEKQLIQRAKDGNVSAQIDLAFSYESAGNTELAAHWMDQAGATGDAAAKMQRAAWKLYGTNFDRDEEAAFLEIQEVASAGGEGNSRTFLAVLLAYGIGCDRDWRQAVEWVACNARAGHARSILQLALLLPDRPENIPLTQSLLNCAARLDSQAIASRGHEPAGVQIQVSELDAAAAIVADCDAALWRPATTTVFSERPRVDIYPNVAPDLWRRHVVRMAQPLLHGAHVKDANSGRRIRDPMRTNTVSLIELWQSDLVFYALSARIASATGDPINRLEPPNILNYRPGQTYQAHFDFINPDVPFFQNELSAQGQRIKTPLIYLNDNYQGGATEFPELKRGYKGVAGDLLVLHNTDKDGNPDRQSLHIGAPPTSGAKWVFSTRVRTKPQVARIWPDI